MLEKIEEYTKRAYATACRHGFHDKELSTEHLLMLVITEVSEMVEADRKGRYANVPQEKDDTIFNPQTFHPENAYFKINFEDYVKDRVEDEMADVCIRLFDLLGVWNNKMGKLNLDKLQDTITSIKRCIECEGRSFTELAFTLCDILTDVGVITEIICRALAFVTCWAEDLGIDLDWHVEKKMQYNELRANKHGKKY